MVVVILCKVTFASWSHTATVATQSITNTALTAWKQPKTFLLFILNIKIDLEWQLNYRI